MCLLRIKDTLSIVNLHGLDKGGFEGGGSEGVSVAVCVARGCCCPTVTVGILEGSVFMFLSGGKRGLFLGEPPTAREAELAKELQMHILLCLCVWCESWCVYGRDATYLLLMT